MQFVDCALARRLEAAEEIPQVGYAAVLQRVRPEVGATTQAIGGGHMAFCGVGSPVGRAVGLAIEGPVSAAEVDRVEQFYVSRGAIAQIDVCPHTDLGLIEILKHRGYRMTELNSVLFRPLSPNEQFPAPPAGIEIRPARPDEAPFWAKLVGRGFSDDGEVPPEMEQMIYPSFDVQNGLPFFGAINGELVAAAGGMIIPDRQMVALAGAATLPAFRGRGLQTAFLNARLRTAAQAGCDLAVTVTRGGTTSQRNAERLGFRVAYSKATLEQPRLG